MSTPTELIARGLDPQNSAVVSACAGSGKTWMLVSRLLRLLLDGARPGEILAITYTRKAAREIELRLRDWLALLALQPEPEVVEFLNERGLTLTEAAAALPRARVLLELVLQADPPITLTTFHGWFGRLLSGAPLVSGLAGQSLMEAVGDLLDEAWSDVASQCARAPQAELAQSLLWLYGELGAYSTRKLLKKFIDRRAEWQAFVNLHGNAEAAIAQVQAAFSPDADPVLSFCTPSRLADLADFAALLGRNTASDQALANTFAQAVLDVQRAILVDQTISGEDFECLRAALLTQENEPRKRKSSAAQIKRLGAADDDRFIGLHVQLSEAMAATQGQLADQQAGIFNGHALRVGVALLDAFAALKRDRRAMDFTDLECSVDSLLADESAAAFVQARLDARYRHVLLDEFQDTNPLQWRIVLAWLSAYAHGAGMSPPSVFMVGDPKQSIYRFRRAEPRLFDAAGAYFVREFSAAALSNTLTRRNAGTLVEVVNAVFGAEDGIVGFEAQTSARADWPALIEVLPLIAAEGDDEANDAPFERDALREAVIEAEDERRTKEAKLLAQRIQAMIGKTQIGVGIGARPMHYGDVLVLTRRRTILAPYEAALRAAGIPFSSPGRGGLLDTLEAQDVLALLQFLAHPGDDLSLAHVLRSPIFDLDNALMLTIAQRVRAQTPMDAKGWWAALSAMARHDARLRQPADLLAGWIADARILPAHDLIDRAFHQSDWFDCCRARVPAALWPGVRANLEALLELALDVDGGRYPSLTRFVDELKRLRISDDDAPSEGLIRAKESDVGRVRFMTIHGAKGLESPLVWLIDAQYTGKPFEGNQPLIDWPPQDTAPRMFSLLGSIKKAGRLRREVIEAERTAQTREALNLLYVAMTRAEQILIVSGIEPRYKTDGSPHARISAALQQLGAKDHCLGEMPLAVASAKTPVTATYLTRQQLSAPVGQRQDWQAEGLGVRFGTAMHAWLEATLRNRPLPVVAPEVQTAAQRILARPSLHRFFDPTQYRRAGNETAYALVDGSQGRIDRWVDDGQTIWIIDYKSGSADDAPLEAYRAQLQRYRQALAEVFPARDIKCILVFTQGAELALD